MTARDTEHTAWPTVLWHIPVSELGGVARHVLDVAREGIPGYRLVVLCPPGPLAQGLESHGIEVCTEPISPTDGALQAVRATRSVLKQIAPDILHTHLAFADLTATLARLSFGLRRRLRHISTEHGISGVRGLYQSHRLSATATSLLHRLRLVLTHRVIAVSESTKAQVARQWGSGHKVVVVRNGVDAPEAVPASTAGLRILSLSRLAPEKNIDQLLQAFALVQHHHPEASLTIAGTGPLEAELQALARNLNLTESVQFAGYVEADSALREHDVVVQLSAWENLSYTLLDAIAYRLGVIATDVGGNSEILPDHCLVSLDNLDNVARAIVQQGRHLDQRPHLSNVDGTPLTTWNVSTMCRAIAGVYEDLR